MRGGNAIATVGPRAGRSRTKYLNNAPPYLVSLHEGKKSAVVRVGKKGDLLGELLTHKNMDDVWRRLSRRIGTNHEWLRVWQEIKNAFDDSRNPPVPSDEESYCMQVSGKAMGLAKLLRRKSGQSIFNLPAYRFCPDDVMSANGVENWTNLDSLQQASQSIIEWPFMVELLDGLVAASKEKAKQAKADSRVMERVSRDANGKPTANAKETYFLRLLHRHLNQILTAKSDGINFVLGQISAVVFSHPDEPYTTKGIQRYIHGS